VWNRQRKCLDSTKIVFVFGRGSAPDPAGGACGATIESLVGWRGTPLPILRPVDVFGTSSPRLVHAPSTKSLRRRHWRNLLNTFNATLIIHQMSPTYNNMSRLVLFRRLVSRYRQAGYSRSTLPSVTECVSTSLALNVLINGLMTKTFKYIIKLGLVKSHTFYWPPHCARDSTVFKQDNSLLAYNLQRRSLVSYLY